MDQTHAEQCFNHAASDYDDTRAADGISYLYRMADAAYERAQEIAASVAALTEEFSSFRMFTSANLRTADRSIAIERERIDAIEAKHGGSSDFYHEPVSPAPPPPDADEPARHPQAERGAFVDALCREYARRWPTRSARSDGPNQKAFRQIFWDAVGTTVDSGVIHAQMLARAAALPERSAAAPVTISRERLNGLVDRWFSESADSFQNRMAAVLQELGHEVEP